LQTKDDRIVQQDAEMFYGITADFKLKDTVSWRIYQVGSILRNLSFEKINKKTLGENAALRK
jgi:hypothetical protein